MIIDYMLAGFGQANADNGDAQIVQGSIGWEGEDDYVFFGTDEDDGHTLVRVQLFEGRDVTKPINPKRAQGHKIICHISSGLFRVPKPDTRVFVAIPKGMEQTPGAGVIFAAIEKSPTSQFAKDRAVMDFGEDVHVVLRGKSVSMQSPDNEFISVGTPRSGGTSGLTFQAKDGSGGVIQEGVVGWFVAKDGAAKTIIQMTPDKIECCSTDGGYMKIDKDFYTLGQSSWVVGGAVYIGKAVAPTSFALYGTTASPTPSTSVFISS